MRNSIVIFVLFFTTLIRQQSEYISIEHIGISDKPIMTIVISKDQIVNSAPEKFLVKNEAYSLLKELICSNEKEKYEGNEFGSFKIALKNAGEKDSYHCLNRRKSIKLFNMLIKVLEKNRNINNELLARLELVKKRLSIKSK